MTMKNKSSRYKRNYIRYKSNYTPEDYLAVAHTKSFQNARFLHFINSITKRRKFKPSRHIVDWKKMPNFSRATFNKKGL